VTLFLVIAENPPLAMLAVYLTAIVAAARGV
jgi:hypothetical protein